MPYGRLLEEADRIIRDALDTLGYPEVRFSVEPSREGHGDASSNVAFLLAGELRLSPREVAAAVAGSCRAGGLVLSVEAHPSGYLNMRADWDRLAGVILAECVREGYGSGSSGAGARVSVEHTSVNPNKALHIGHVRNIVVGDVISRILRKAGHTVRVLNYIDDSGLQVADVVLGFTRLGFAAEPPGGEKFDAYCGDRVYVGTTRECEKDPSLQEARREILREIERGDTESARVAERVTRRVLAAQLQTCWNLGVRYDLLNYESQIVRSGLWGRAFERLKREGLATLETGGENAGCWVMGEKVIVRSNGTATYMAKDIPYAAWKLGLLEDPFGYEEYPGGQPGGPTLYQSTLEGGRPMDFAAERVITVIDTRQASLQKAVSEAVSRISPGGEGSYVHLGYEAVTLSPGTAGQLGMDTGGRAQMSGRRGIYIGADAVYETLCRRAAAETAKRNPGMDARTLEAVSRAVAVGTIRYEMIRQDLGRAIVFDLERSTSLEGDTAPYLLYSHARACRILEKAPGPPDHLADPAVLESGRERDLIRLLGMYGMVVEGASANLSPKVVARYCHDLAVAFNAFYESSRVIGAGGPLENARLRLVDGFGAVIRDALGILGIEAPARM